jgi:hypothetical protein
LARFLLCHRGIKSFGFLWKANWPFLYLIFMLIVTIAYVEVSPIKHAKASPIVARIQAASE